MGKYELRSLFHRKYEGHPWTLKDLFITNNDDNAAYLCAIEEVYEKKERIPGKNYDKDLRDAFAKFAGIKIGMLTKGEIQELQNGLNGAYGYLKDYKYFEDVHKCVKNIIRKVTEEGDISDIKITEKQKEGLKNLPSEIEIKLAELGKTLKEREARITEINNNADAFKTWKKIETAKEQNQIDELKAGICYLNDVKKIIKKVNTIITRLTDIKHRSNKANKELIKLNFITGTDTKRHLLKNYKINYEVLAKSWPKVPRRLELKWDPINRYHYEVIDQTYVFSKQFGFLKVNVEDIKTDRNNEQLRQVLCKKIKEELLMPISLHDSPFIFPQGWEKHRNSKEFFRKLVLKYNKNIRILAKKNRKEPIDASAEKFNQSLELVAGVLAAAYHPMAAEESKDYDESLKELRKVFETLSEAKDKKELKRIELSITIWEKRKEAVREKLEKETAFISWADAFDTMIYCLSSDNRGDSDINDDIDWIKMIFIEKLLTYREFTDSFKNVLPPWVQKLDLQPLVSLINDADHKSIESSDRPAGTERDTELHYDPEIVFIALWYYITRSDYEFCN